MTRETYPNTSPYSTSPQTSWYLGSYVHRYIPPDAGDRPITISSRYDSRPFLLSNDLYGTDLYWWVFAVRNPWLRYDPIFGMKAGKEIIVPSAAHVRKVYG